MGPVKHEYRTAGGDGVLSGKQYQESANSAKPVPPFPFLKEDLLINESDKKRLDNIWEWTKSIHARTKETVHTKTICGICEGIVTEFDLLQRCFNCKSPVHETCLSTENTGWSEVEENLFCEQCVIISHIDLNTSVGLTRF